jgi:hypothetical protein
MSDETNCVTKEIFYEEIARAIENVREEMKVHTVVMRCDGYDLLLPIISVCRGEVVVAGPACSLKYDMNTGRMIEVTIEPL